MSAVTTPAEPLEIFECPACGSQMMHMPSRFRQWEHFIPNRGAQTCHVAPVPVKVFRAETVRPLYETLGEIAGHNYSGWSGGVPDRLASEALAAFPAPKEWKR